MSLKDIFDKKDEDCGTGVLRYTDPPESIIEFPNYGFKITVSDKN